MSSSSTREVSKIMMVDIDRGDLYGFLATKIYMVSSVIA